MVCEKVGVEGIAFARFHNYSLQHEILVGFFIDARSAMSSHLSLHQGNECGKARPRTKTLHANFVGAFELLSLQGNAAASIIDRFKSRALPEKPPSKLKRFLVWQNKAKPKMERTITLAGESEDDADLARPMDQIADDYRPWSPVS